MSRSEAEAEAGFRVHTLPGSDVLAVEVGEVDGHATVRVRQRITPEVELTLIQTREPLPTEAGHPGDDRSVATTSRGGVSIVALASMAVDSLSALLARVR